MYKIQNSSNPLAKWMFKLSDEQKERQFDPKQISTDPSHRICLVCNNPSINEPPENKAVLAHNNKVQSDFDLLTE